MAVDDAYVFSGFLTPILSQLFLPEPLATFLTCFCRGERRKYAGKKSRLNRGSNSQPPGHVSNTLTTEPLGRGIRVWGHHYSLTYCQTTNLDSSKLKKFADNNFKFDENGSKLSKQVENTAGKGEIARYEQFLLFPVFSEGLFPRGVKSCHCVGMG